MHERQRRRDVLHLDPARHRGETLTTIYDSTLCPLCWFVRGLTTSRPRHLGGPRPVCVCVWRRRARRWSICLQLWAPVCVAFTRAHSVDNGRHGCQVELTCTLANMPVWRHESAVYDVSPPGPMQRRIIHSHPATHATAPPCAEQCSAVRPLFDLQSLSSSSPPAPPVRCYCPLDLTLPCKGSRCGCCCCCCSWSEHTRH